MTEAGLDPSTVNSGAVVSGADARVVYGPIGGGGGECGGEGSRGGGCGANTGELGWGGSGLGASGGGKGGGLAGGRGGKGDEAGDAVRGRAGIGGGGAGICKGGGDEGLGDMGSVVRGVGVGCVVWGGGWGDQWALQSLQQVQVQEGALQVGMVAARGAQARVLEAPVGLDSLGPPNLFQEVVRQ